MNDKFNLEISSQKTGQANGGQPGAGGGGRLTAADVYFVLFRRKWLILTCTIVGIVGGAIGFWQVNPAYHSDAKLLIRYILEQKSVEPAAADGQVRQVDSRGENIINSEVELLTSLDLCEQVAALIGPEKILGPKAGSNDVAAASLVLRNGLLPDVPRHSDVIKITLTHSSAEVAEKGLAQLVEMYKKRHAEVHRALGTYDVFLSQQIDQTRDRLSQVEDDLRTARTNAGVIVVDDSKHAYTEQLSHLRQEIFATQAQLAEILVATNFSSSSASTNLADSGPSIPMDKVAEYRTTSARLDGLRNREFELLQIYTERNLLVKNIREQIQPLEARKKEMEKEFPHLVETAPAARYAGGATPSPNNDLARAGGLRAKLNVLSNQWSEVRAEVSKLDANETGIARLQREKDTLEKNLAYFKQALDRARFDEALASGRLSNISVIQAPTHAWRDNLLRMKVGGGIVAGGLVLGLGLAFLLELVIDQTVKRPSDIEGKLHLPLFFAIPRLPRGRKVQLVSVVSTASAAQGPGSSRADDTNIWSLGHPLRPFFEGLRDRTMVHFDQLARKPKLVGVTGIGAGGGATTVAAGLAATLSESGGGKVLLLDLNLNQQQVHPFFHGRPGCGFADALENESRQDALVSENFYMALARPGQGGGAENLPMQLSRMFPRLRLSDYDYIVFDMPKVSQTGITARLSGMLDLVLLVVESEKDHQDGLRHALNSLHSAGAKVAGVLNKVEDYLPRRMRNPFYEPLLEK